MKSIWRKKLKSEKCSCHNWNSRIQFGVLSVTDETHHWEDIFLCWAHAAHSRLQRKCDSVITASASSSLPCCRKAYLKFYLRRSIESDYEKDFSVFLSRRRGRCRDEYDGDVMTVAFSELSGNVQIEFTVNCQPDDNKKKFIRVKSRNKVKLLTLTTLVVSRLTDNTKWHHSVNKPSKTNFFS